MSQVRSRFQEILPDSATPAQKLRSLAQAKAEVLTTEWDNFAGKNMEGSASFSTRQGVVTIGAMRHRPAEKATELDSVEVWLGSGSAGPPAWRLINPPTLVPDPAGNIIIAERTTPSHTIHRRYREDPLAAVAEFLASNQGRSEQG